MSDPEQPGGRPEDDQPSWAPFGSSGEDRESLWSGGDPVAPERPQQPAGAPEPPQSPPEAPERPQRPADAPERPQQPAAPFRPPAPPSLGQAPGLTPGDPLGGAAPPPQAPGSGYVPPPPPPGGTAWPPPHIAPAALERRTSGNAIAALVLGILGLVFCPIVCSVAAIALGRSARRDIDANPRLDGRTLAQAGIVLGVAGLVIYLLFALLLLLGASVSDTV